MKDYTIDAKGKKLGRVASEAAKILRGKDSVDFARNIAPDIAVKIINASQADISEKKMKEKVYLHYTGYPGGLRSKTAQQVVDKKGYGELFTKAVYGMLPGNKLRDVIMKKLTVVE